MNREACAMALCAAAICIVTPTAAQEQRHWINPTGGTFSDPANWQSGQLPGTFDTAIFDLPGQSFEVDFSADAAHERLELSHSNLTFDLRGNTYAPASIDVDDAALRIVNGTVASQLTTIGENGNASLVIEDGGQLESIGSVGASGGSNGEVTVRGTGRWANNSGITIGAAGSGKFTLENGGYVMAGGAIGVSAGSQGELSVLGPGSTWEGQYLTVGHEGSGRLFIRDGGQVKVAGATFGALSGSNAEMIIDGSGSLFEADLIQVGSGATIAVSNGGTLSGSTFVDSGELTIRGAGSSFIGGGLEMGDGDRSRLFVGDGASISTNAVVVGAGPQGALDSEAHISGPGTTIDGSLLVGGKATISDGAVVRGFVGSAGWGWGPGEVLVTGVGTLWENTESLTVGTAGSEGTGAALTIENGARVAAKTSYIGGGTPTTSSVVVRGVGSSWDTSGELYVGYIDEASTLTVEEGATISSHDAIIGYVSLRAHVTITGPGSRWLNTGQLWIGRDGVGTLEILDGAVVKNTLAVIGEFNDEPIPSKVLVSGAGSVWENLGAVHLAGFYEGYDVPAILDVNDGGLVIAEIDEGLRIRPLGALVGDGGTVQGTVTSMGLVSPGEGLGLLTIDGDYVQQEMGRLAIELAGTGPGMYDQLVVTGDVTLDGTLNVSLIPGFMLALNQRFEILPVGETLTGSFTGLAEGARVGKYNGVELFITYGSAGAPGVALYTIPEPRTAVLMVAGMALLAAARVRRRAKGGRG